MKKVSLIFALLTVILTGCAAPTATTPAPNQPTAYPVAGTTNTPAEGAYPITQPEYIPFDTPNPYPSDAAASPDAFRINKPLSAGDTQVSGTGPAGVPIFLMDITKMGLPLAETKIGADGKFVFTLPEGLEASHRVGILLGGLEGTKWKPEDFYPRRYYGDEARQVPQIGFFHDTALVHEKP